MNSGLIIVLLATAIFVLLIVRAYVIVRREAGDRIRGSEPGTGYHTIHAEYSSGLSGHHTTYKIPRDPQEYARYFVPRQPTDKSK